MEKKLLQLELDMEAAKRDIKELKQLIMGTPQTRLDTFLQILSIFLPLIFAQKPLEQYISP